jgi:alpha-1,6-mannosyltransferase
VKICDLALFSLETSSGVRTYIENKIRYVSARRDIEHVVIVPGRHDRRSMRMRSKLVIVRGVPSFYPGIRICFNLRKVAALVRAESPDLIEINCQYTLAWAAFLASRETRIPIVGVYHTDLPACVRHLTRGAGQAISSTLERITEFYEGLIYRHCTLTVLLNAAMRSRVGRMGVNRTSCVPCGVDLETFHPERRSSALRQRLGIGPGRKIICYAGRLSAEKEVDILIDAFRQLDPAAFALVVAGDGPMAALMTRHAESNPAVFYLGHYDSPSKLAAVYASSDVFVIPGRYETFGMATLEALACGLPVVGIRSSGSESIVPAEVGLLAVAGQAADLAGKIEEVAAWPYGRRAACRAFAEGYSWDSVFSEYFGIYRQLIADHLPRSAS